MVKTLREACEASLKLTRQRYLVYFDSTRKTFSVRDQTTRRVAFKSDHLVLRDARFVVGERGRRRVLREGRKAVHAGVVSSDVAVPNASPQQRKGGVRVTYNPYRNPTFVEAGTGRPVHAAALVVCSVVDGRAVVEIFDQPTLRNTESKSNIAREVPNEQSHY